MTTTLAALQAGSENIRWVLAIEGCPYLVTNAETATEQAWVQAAYAGTSYDDGGVQVLGGLKVDLRNSQAIDPYNPFTGGGKCTVRVQDITGEDTFGILVAKRAAGAFTSLKATLDRDDTTVAVYSTNGFPASGYVHIGTECIKYSGKTATSFTGCTRGMFSPLKRGTGANNFANHHRVGADERQVQLSPVVSEVPRLWIGRRVCLFLHVVEGSGLNTRDEAVKAFVGRIADIDDDSNTGDTVFELEHVLDEVRSSSIFREPWGGTIGEGLWIPAGRVFYMDDSKSGSPGLFANALEVVASGASGTNQMDEGRYTLAELCEKLSAWCAGEKAANRIYGYYTWASPVSSNIGPRTKCYWRIEHASDVVGGARFQMPGEVAAFLGIRDIDPDSRGVMCRFYMNDRTNRDNLFQGDCAPFENLFFKPSGPGRLAQEFLDQSFYEVENERGTFVGQRDQFPASIREACSPDYEWGLFMLDERALMVGAYDPVDGRLENCWLAPFPAQGASENDALTYIGRRIDEPERGPMTVRQVLLLEDTTSDLLNALMFSTGTAGYNHATHDSLTYGLGLGLPGEILSAWEASLANLPQADMPMSITLDESTELAKVLGGDFQIRRLFVRWKNGSIDIGRWVTPQTASATLTDANKAASAGTKENHRSPTRESAHWQKPVVKIDYGRAFAVGRNGDYQMGGYTFEDKTAVDDAGGRAKPYTIELRNIHPQLTNVGAAIEALAAFYLETMTVFSKPLKFLGRSIGHPHFEGFGVGDGVQLQDGFARDPVSGVRSISSRVGFVVKHSWSYSSGRGMAGSVELVFLDLQRGGLYGPTAQVDDTAGAGGFSAGYNNGTLTLRCYAHKHSEASEPVDASYFNPNDRVAIVEIDPADPATAVAWERTVSSSSGNDVVLTAALSSPAWDPTKKYRIMYDRYSVVQTSQRINVFQADDDDEQVEDLANAQTYSTTPEDLVYTPNSGELGEYVAARTYGDGRSLDVGTDAALGRLANAVIDYKSAHQAPVLGEVNSAGGIGYWCTLMMIPIFFGTEHLSAQVTRSLTVAPWMRQSPPGGVGKLRATLARMVPTLGPGVPPIGLGGPPYSEPRFTDAVSQTSEWLPSSTTWEQGSDKTLSIGVKDLFFGYAFLVIEGYGFADTRGLAKCIEGPRTVL